MELQRDCLIIGAGPAGLTAAIYLARYRLSVAIIDGGQSRAAIIPKLRNLPGFPDGISGVDLLERMRRQAGRYGISVISGAVEKIGREADQFLVDGEGVDLAARSILLATGVINNRPPIPDGEHDRAVALGHLRYCPICDGYEVTDKPVAVIGTGAHGVKEALFLRAYTPRVSLISPGKSHDLDETQRHQLDIAGVVALEGPCISLRSMEAGMEVETPAGKRTFASVYPALGSVIRSELARMLGGSMTPEGCLLVDEHQRTSVPGLYAAGDVAKGLDQISHAIGEASVASTAIRNDLAARTPLFRSA